MSANVQCAGDGKTARDPAPFGLGPTHYERATNGKPCGWKGERGRSWPDSWRNGYGWEKFVTNKPCPRCGGQVEIIGHTQEVER